MFDVNVKSIFLFAHAVVPLAREIRRDHQYRLDRRHPAAPD
jgi:hypothetical protein